MNELVDLWILPPLQRIQQSYLETQNDRTRAKNWDFEKKEEKWGMRVGDISTVLVFE